MLFARIYFALLNFKRKKRLGTSVGLCFQTCYTDVQRTWLIEILVFLPQMLTASTYIFVFPLMTLLVNFTIVPSNPSQQKSNTGGVSFCWIGIQKFNAIQPKIHSPTLPIFRSFWSFFEQFSLLWTFFRMKRIQWWLRSKVCHRQQYVSRPPSWKRPSRVLKTWTHRM